jgi:DNA-binding transcriptional LysR family regulator
MRQSQPAANVSSAIGPGFPGIDLGAPLTQRRLQCAFDDRATALRAVRRMSQAAAHRVDHVILQVPVRQQASTLPIPLRPALVDAEDDLLVECLRDERASVVAVRTHPLAAHGHLQWPELLQQRWVLPPADCSFCEHVRRSLERMHMLMPRHAVEATSVQLQFELVRHAGMLSFGMCSPIGFAPGKEFVVRLPFDLPVTSTSVAAVRLKSHEPSPLARLLLGHIQTQSKTLPLPVAPARQEFAAIEATP